MGAEADIINSADRYRSSRISGPAHRRIIAESAYFYRNNANSIITVTRKVTQTRERFALYGI